MLTEITRAAFFYNVLTNMKRSSTVTSTQTAGSNVSKRSKTSKRKTGKFNSVTPGAMVTIPYSAKYGFSPFPPKLKTTLTYNDVVTLNLSLGLGTYQFTCNGLYDPDVTIAGHQPLYFDQIMAIYDHYTVQNSWITVEPSGLSSKDYQINLYVDDDTSIAAGASAPERPGCVSCYGNPLVAKLPVLRNKWNASQTFGPSVLDDPSMQGTSSGNPTELSYYTITAQDIAAGTTSLTLNVKIRYTVIFDELATIPPS